jgi:hypothetical protein
MLSGRSFHSHKKDDLTVITRLDGTGGRRAVAGRARFVAGIVLMALSFLVYPAYPMILFLSFPDRVKIGVAVLASLLSWGVFCGGFYLAGREGYEWLKRRKVR